MMTLWTSEGSLTLSSPFPGWVTGVWQEDGRCFAQHSEERMGLNALAVDMLHRTAWRSRSRADAALLLFKSSSRGMQHSQGTRHIC